jgi:hypothetical protein
MVTIPAGTGPDRPGLSRYEPFGVVSDKSERIVRFEVNSDQASHNRSRMVGGSAETLVRKPDARRRICYVGNLIHAQIRTENEKVIHSVPLAALQCGRRLADSDAELIAWNRLLPPPSARRNNLCSAGAAP